MQTVKDDEVKLYADFDNRQRVQSIGRQRQPGKTIPVIDFSAYTNDGSLEERQRVARALTSNAPSPLRAVRHPPPRGRARARASAAAA